MYIYTIDMRRHEFSLQRKRVPGGLEPDRFALAKPPAEWKVNKSNLHMSIVTKFLHETS